MWTAVVGGSIQRAAIRISAASDQRTVTLMTSQRTRVRTKRGLDGAPVRAVEVWLTLQNNRHSRSGKNGIEPGAWRNPGK